jgi:hypothetical protein
MKFLKLSSFLKLGFDLIQEISEWFHENQGVILFILIENPFLSDFSAHLLADEVEAVANDRLDVGF